MRSGKSRFVANMLPSRLRTYFFSYVLLVALLLMVLGGIVYTGFFRTLQRVVEHSNVTSLTQIRDQVDQRFDEIMKIAVQISRNSKLIPHLITANEYEAIQAVDELRSYGSTNSFLFDIGVRLQEADPRRIYAASGIYRTDVFFGSAYPFPEWQGEAFLRDLQSLREPRTGLIEPLSINGTTPSPVGYYMYPVPTGGKPYQIIFFILNGQELHGMIYSMLEEYDGFAFVTDKQGRTILSVGSGAFTSSAERLQGEIAVRMTDEQVQSVHLPEGHFSIVRLESRHTDWVYSVVMPTSQFIREVEQSRTVFYAAVALVFLLGVAASYVLASRNYRPIRSLLERVKREIPSPVIPGKDEMDWISRSFEEITLENNGLRSQLKTKAVVVKEQLLLQAFRGSLPQGRELAEQLVTAGMALEGPHFAVMLVLIDRYDIFAASNSLPMQNVLKYGITNVAEEIALEYGSGYAIDLADDKGVAVLLSLDAAAETEAEAAVRRIAERVRHFFEQSFPFTVTVGASLTFADPSRAPRHWKQAYEAGGYRYMLGWNRVIHYRDAAAIRTQSNVYPLPGELGLLREIKQGNRVEASLAARGLLDELRGRGGNPANVRSMELHLAGSLLQVVQEFELPTDEELGTARDRLLSGRFETTEQFGAAYIELALEIAGRIALKKESKNFELRDNLLQYIETHYMDETLCLNKIAAAFGLSPSYVSRYFKNQTGVALSQHIDELRMDRSSELLRTGDLTVKEVGGRVGYGDQTTFIRKFKRKFGLTPQQYKQLSAGPGEGGHNQKHGEL